MNSVKTPVQIIKPSTKGENQMFLNIKKLAAIACVSMAVGVATIPSIVSAQNSSQPSSTETRKPHNGNGWKKLNLTDAQKAQMKTIRENAKTQTDAVLTPEQRDILQKSHQSGDHKGVWKSLNLTDAQKQQLKTIRENTQAQMKSVLTPEQQQQVSQMKKR